MRRADRLFQLVQLLRNRRQPVTAQQLAERLDVSARTIYRDIQDLSLSGVPVEGEAGVGYQLRHSLDIPPLMFDADEVQALVLGARMVKTWGGNELAQAAQQAIEKIEGALPNELRHLTSESHVYAIPYRFDNELTDNLQVLRTAINTSLAIAFDYTTAEGVDSTRGGKPLALYFWGRVWTLVAWCDLRQDFRSFRIDRMRGIVHRGGFEPVPGQRLDDFIALMVKRDGELNQKDCPSE